MRGRVIYDRAIYDVGFCEEDDREDKKSSYEMMIDVLVDREVLGRMEQVGLMGRLGQIGHRAKTDETDESG